MSGDLVLPTAFGVTGVSCTPTSLRVSRDLPFAEWEMLVVKIVAGVEALQWALADALAYGEACYGETYAQISATLEQAGLRRSPGTLANYVYVATRVQRSLRNEGVQFSLHQLVAPFDPPTQTKLLTRAAEEGWTWQQMREAVSELRGLPAAVPGPDAAAALAALREATRQVLNTVERGDDGYGRVPLDALDELDRVLGEQA